MARANHQWERKVALELGVGTVDFTTARVGQTLHLPCSRGHTVDFFINARMPPKAVVKKMMQAGWTVGHKLTCPEHTRKKPNLALVTSDEALPAPPAPVAAPPPKRWVQRAPKPLRAVKPVADDRPIHKRIIEALTQFERPLSTKDLADLTFSKENSVLWAARRLVAKGEIVRVEPQKPAHFVLASKLPPEPKEEPVPELAAVPTPPAPTPQATDAARTAKRLTIMALEESFNDGRYKPGVSDATIAKDTGLSAVKVAEYREEFFGPIKEPSEIAAARAELDTLENRIAHFEREAGETVEQWRAQLAAHRQRLADLIKRNGWNT